MSATDPGDESGFHSNHYLRLNQRRLEHLASLRLNLSSKTVLELGAGIGDLSTFFLDRDCRVTSVEARPENRARMASNVNAYYSFYPWSSRPRLHRTLTLDLEEDAGTGLGTFDVVLCYGILYHVRDPARLIRLMGAACDGLCLVETCVSPGSDISVSLVPEDAGQPSQAFHGMGCRPTRAWVFETLRQVFSHVYVPRTQPDHEEFPIDWSSDPPNRTLTRAVFVASRAALDNPLLVDSLPAIQTRA